ncbi:MAG: hypothetical protein MJ210_00475, partial [Alphaproteobacteria bacterium]|nr:hypothetical protein [Alphaproteobacteria bacterium]
TTEKAVASQQSLEETVSGVLSAATNKSSTAPTTVANSENSSIIASNKAVEATTGRNAQASVVNSGVKNKTATENTTGNKIGTKNSVEKSTRSETVGNVNNSLSSPITNKVQNVKEVPSENNEQPVFVSNQLQGNDFGYRMKGNILEEKALPQSKVEEGDIYKLNNNEGSFVWIKDNKQGKFRWLKLPKEVVIDSVMTAEKADEITAAVNKELSKEQISKQEGSATGNKPARAVFKTSAGYGYSSQTFSLAFADIKVSTEDVQTGETNNGIYIINDELASRCFGKEGYKGAIKDINLAECYQKLNEFSKTANEDLEKMHKKYPDMPDMDEAMANKILRNAYMEDLAAQYIESLNLYNRSLEFKNNEVSPLVTSHVTTNHDAVEIARKMNMLVGEKLNEQAQFQARALSNKIKKLYYNYKIGIREE